MMTAEALRRLLKDAEIDGVIAAQGIEPTVDALREILDRLADRERLFEASSTERGRMARLAAALLYADQADDDVVSRLRLAKGTWREKAAAADELMQRRAWTPAHFLGNIVSTFQKRKTLRPRTGADAAIARALVIAIRDIAMPDVARWKKALHGSARAALREAPQGEEIWEAALQPLLGLYAGHARALGADRRGAILKTLAATAVLKGEGLCEHEEHRALALALGSAAATLLAERPSEANAETQALHALTQAIAAENSTRLLFWDAHDAEDVRRLGAAAAMAAFGRGRIGAPVALAASRSSVAFRLPESWHEIFSHVAALDAADALERRAADPRATEEERLMAEALSETLRAHPGAAQVSFSEALKIEPAALRTGAFRPGGSLLRASLRGQRPTSIICVGKRDRTVRCRAVTDADGALLGYQAFDPFSRELGGTPLYALYDLEGRRYGYAWTTQPPVVRAGAPAQGFATAPETIPV